MTKPEPASAPTFTPAACVIALTVASGAMAQSPASGPPSFPVGPDAPPWALGPVRPERDVTVVKRSLYVPGADGTRLAVDVYLPADAEGGGAKLPAVLEQTRYYRSLAFKADPAGSCRAVPPPHAFFARRGYAVVVVDVRGSGASFGTRTNEFSAEEVKDGGAVVDWIVAQPWSNGRIGATGGSYGGTTAELLLLNRRPAVKAVASVSAGYDFYADIDFPGGVRGDHFIQGWGALNAALDSGRPDTAKGMAPIKGPCPVDADTDGALLAAALAQHAGNVNSATALRTVDFRDDGAMTGGAARPEPFTHRAEIDASGTPLLSIVGWADSGYARAGIDRFLNTTSPQQRLIVNAGNHSTRFFYTPGLTAPTRSAFSDMAETLRFFDRYVAGTGGGYDREPRLRWFTTGANAWTGADAWPATRAVQFALEADGGLSPGRGGPASSRTVAPADARTGATTRWDTILGGGPVLYPDRAEADATLATFTSAPLDHDLTVTGAAELTLAVTNTAKDADYFAYLEEVGSDGRVSYLTEGELRASHSRPGRLPYRTLDAQRSDLRRDAKPDTAGVRLQLRIPLLPTAHRFARGTRLRVALAGSDKAHFASPALDGQRWSLALGASGSALILPIADAP